jgi:hypothetical protein
MTNSLPYGTFQKREDLIYTAAEAGIIIGFMWIDALGFKNYHKAEQEVVVRMVIRGIKPWRRMMTICQFCHCTFTVLFTSACPRL